jgi:molybdenum cofactor biosynthesis enzyme MoaA
LGKEELMITLLDVSLLNCCTYSCDYCISKASFCTSVNHAMPDGTLRAIYSTNGMTLKPFPFINFILNHFLPEECIIQLSGGEPLLHDAFPFIVRTLIEHGYQVVINSNGNQINHCSKSYDVNFILDDRHKIPKWRISWHTQFRDYDSLCRDIKELNYENVLINYVAHPKKIESNEILKDIEILECEGAKRLLKYEVTAFQGRWNEKEYDKNSLLYRPYITAFKAETKTLAVPINYLAIQPNGDIMRCHKVNVGNVYENKLRERYPHRTEPCSYVENGNTSCGLVQSLYLLGLL